MEWEKVTEERKREEDRRTTISDKRCVKRREQHELFIYRFLLSPGLD